VHPAMQAPTIPAECFLVWRHVVRLDMFVSDLQWGEGDPMGLSIGPYLVHTDCAVWWAGPTTPHKVWRLLCGLVCGPTIAATTTV
jgi:hypothetical protein